MEWLGQLPRNCHAAVNFFISIEIHFQDLFGLFVFSLRMGSVEVCSKLRIRLGWGKVFFLAPTLFHRGGALVLTIRLTPWSTEILRYLET